MKYSTAKELIQKRVNNFPMVFAFNNEQFDKAMKDLGIKDWTEENLKDKIVSIGGGGYIKKDMVEEYKNLWFNIDKDIKRYLEESDENFIDAIKYELSNHEYGYTHDLEPALEALGLIYNELSNKQKELVEKARKEHLEESDY